MRFTEQLAQKIVKKTMSVLGKNINIMNHNGIIIGSGEKHRINTYHEGAARVIETGKMLVVKEDEVEEFRGVKVGINLPIKFNDKIIGVVGITGKPEEVGGYGEIVKNMVELMLQQEFLQREIELENKARENYYQQLLSNNLNDEMFNDRARLFNVNLDLYRVVMVIKVEPFDNRVLNNEINTLYSLLNLENDQDIFFIRGENLIFIKSFKTSKFKKQCLEVKSLANIILTKLKSVFTTVEIGIGQIFPGIEKLYLSYEGAKHALEVGKKVYNSMKNRIYFLNHLGYDYFLPYIDSASAEYYLHHMFENNIVEIFSDTDIGQVIEALVENNFNISQTAEDLFIHRNTVLYKLNKIKEMTGLDPKNIKHLFTLLLAYHLYLYKK